MKIMLKVLLITLVAWSAFADTAVVRHDRAIKTQAAVLAAPNGDQSVALESSGSRDLRNGNYFIACQTEDGTYLPDLNNYIYSPIISIPEGSEVQFDLWVSGYFNDSNQGDDFWGCQLQIGGTGNWFYLSNPYGSATGNNYIYVDAPDVWSSFVNSYSLDGRLDDYAGMDVQFRLYFSSDSDTPDGEGVYFDDISLYVDGTEAYMEDFEDGDFEGWETVDVTGTPAMWHQTTVGAYDGQSWAMNDPDLGTSGGYLNDWYQVLDSPPVLLPREVTNTLTFYQNRNIEGMAGATDPWDGWDGTNVRISADDGLTWEVLTDVTPAYNSQSMASFGDIHGEGAHIPGWGGATAGWESVSFTIPSSYDNLNVKIRFAFAADGAFDSESVGGTGMFGWLIDDIDIAGVLTNDGSTSEGWVAASNIPVAGDLWRMIHVVTPPPTPSGLVAVGGDNVVDVSWTDFNISQEVTFAYGDGELDAFIAGSVPWVSGAIAGAAFTSRYETAFPTELETFSYMISSGNTANPGQIEPIVVTVWDATANIIYESEEVTPAAMDSLLTFDLSEANISVDGGFYIGWAFTDTTYPFIAMDGDGPYAGEAYGWHPEGTMLILDGTGLEGNFALYATGTTTSEGGYTYNIYRRGEGEDFSTPLNDTPLTEAMFTDSTAVNGTGYFYAVTSIYDADDTNESAFSAEAYAFPESQSVVELGYDDGTAEAGFSIGPNNYQAVKFTPSGYPALVKRVKFFIQGEETVPLFVYAWDDEGFGDSPLGVHAFRGWSFPEPGWNVLDFAEAGDSIWINSGASFYVGIKELAGSPAIGADIDGGYGGLSFYGMDDGAGGIEWDNMTGLGSPYNLMFRVDVDTAFYTVGIEEVDNLTLPESYALEQNYPNPFNPNTEISYSLPESGDVELKVFDLNGRQVDVLVQERQAAGTYRVRLDGSHMSSGIYIYTLNSGNAQLTRKMILLK